jgi:hypothetical protein
VNRLRRCLRVFRLVQPFPRINVSALLRLVRNQPVLVLGFASVLLGVVGCADPTVPGSRIIATRVLGARVDVAGDLNQTRPAPGEDAHVTWLVAGPGAPRPVAWAFQAWACDGDPDADHCANVGSAVAAGPAGVAGTSDGTVPPQLTVTVPDATEVAARALTRLLIRGVICAGGGVADPNAAAWSRCATTATDGGASVDETDVQMTVALRLTDDGNRPPTLSDDPIVWAKDTWTAGGGDEPTAGGGVPCVDAPGAVILPVDKSNHLVVVTTDGADRETYVPIAPDSAALPAAVREGLQLSAFATAGTFDSQFAGIESTETTPTPSFELNWTPPDVKDDPVPASGRLVRFIFVLRDLRGGVDWSTRTLCLVPAPVSSI